MKTKNIWYTTEPVPKCLYNGTCACACQPACSHHVWETKAWLFVYTYNATSACLKLCRTNLLWYLLESNGPQAPNILGTIICVAWAPPVCTASLLGSCQGHHGNLPLQWAQHTDTCNLLLLNCSLPGLPPPILSSCLSPRVSAGKQNSTPSKVLIKSDLEEHPDMWAQFNMTLTNKQSRLQVKLSQVQNQTFYFGSNKQWTRCVAYWCHLRHQPLHNGVWLEARVPH